MNKKDMIIISQLRNDARISLTNLSKKTSIPVTTIFDSIKANKKNNIIKKFTSLINFPELGYKTRANIAFKVESSSKEELRDYLLKHQSINSLSRINNGYDFMIEGVFKEIIDMENFLDEVESRFQIQDKKSFFIVEDLKKEAFMNDELFLGLKNDF